MVHPNHERARTRESGNIFTFLFGAVAVVGVITAVTMNLISGPIRTASRVNALNSVEAQMIAGGKILILDAVTQTNDGDVDSDGTIEPREYTTQAGGITGGGSIPATVGATRTDPWGILFGYCVWDAGSVDNGKNDAGTGTTNRLNGANTQTDTVLALISAGPDKVFQTTCYAFDGSNPQGVSKASGSDDIVMKWTYAEARAASSEMWNIKAGTPSTATIAKDLEITDPNAAGAITASINRATGVGDFLGITTDLITAKTGGDIQLTGRLGIGATPLDQLQVNYADTALVAGTSNAALRLVNTDLTNNTLTTLKFGTMTSTPNTRSTVLIGSYNTDHTEGSVDGDFFIATNNNNTITEKVRVLNNGDVGIGDSTPDGKLGVVDTYTAASGNRTGAHTLLTTAPTGASSANTFGSYAQNSYTPDFTNTGAVYGSYGYANAAHNSGTLTYLIGNGVASLNNGTGTVTDLRAAFNFASNFSTGTVGTLYGAYNFGANSSTGAVTNLYGAYNDSYSNTAGPVTTMVGAVNRAFNGSTNAATTMRGAQNWAYNGGAATVGTAQATLSQINNTGTVTNGYGVQVDLSNTGTVSNYYGLKVEDEGTASANWYSLYVGNSSGTGTKSFFGGNIGVGSGKTAPSTAIDVNGTVTATNLTLTSDARKKTNVQALTKGLENILRLNPVTYEWKTGTDEAAVEKGLHYGLIAQDAEKIFPEMVKTDNKGMKSINYTELFAPVIDAIKTLYSKVTDLFDLVGKLTVRIEALEKENALLKARLDKLESGQH